MSAEPPAAEVSQPGEKRSEAVLPGEQPHVAPHVHEQHAAPEYAPQAHAAGIEHAHPAAPPEQGHFGHHQQLLYAQPDPNGHHLAHLQQQEQHIPAPDAPPEEQGTHSQEQEAQHPQAQDPHDQHAMHAQPQSGPIAMPHPAGFAQQLMDPQLSQQQLAHYHQQLAQFQPHAYHQQYHPQHLQEVSQLYFAQGLPPGQLQQAYQDAAGNVHDPSKLQDMSIDEAAAAHLTALRHTGRGDGQIAEGHPSQVALGQPPLHLAVHSGMPEGHQNAPRAFGHPDPHSIIATSGRIPSKRKAWRASHEGQGVELNEPIGDGSRLRRKQTRRPDRLCHHEGCFVTPTYNYPNEKKRIFCVSHKLDGMVNVVAKRCAHPDCTVNPRFNYEGHTRGMYCSEHKLEGMVNVIDRRCQEPECKKFPSHNYPGSHKKLFCASHKKEGMVIDPFLDYLKQDAEPGVLARSATLGFFLGLCPVVGVSAGLCILACFVFGSWLHAPMALLFNFVAVPIELLLIVPFMRFGELVLRADAVNVIPEHFKDLFRPGEALKGLGHAVVGWLIICAVLSWPVALALTPAFAFLRRKYAQLQRVGSDEGALLEGHHDDRSTASDMEMALGTPTPPSPLSGSRTTLSPRSGSAPGVLQKFSPHV